MKIGTLREINLDRFPAVLHEHGPRLVGSIIMLFGFIFGGLPLAGVYFLVRDNAADPGSLASIAVFVLAGAGLFVLGLNLTRKKTMIRIDAGAVEYRYTTLFSRVSWRERLDDYTGVLLKTDDRSDEYCSVIELHSKRPDRCVELFAYRQLWVPEETIRKKWKDVAARLELPALEQTSEGIINSDRDKTGTALHDQPAKPTSINGAASGNVPPQGISYRYVKSEHLIEITRKRSITLRSLIAPVIAAVLLYIGFSIGDSIEFHAVGIFGAALAAVIFIYTAWDLISTERLIIGPVRITANRRTPWGSTRGTYVPRLEIEIVKIDRNNTYRIDAVIIQSSKNKIVFAQGLPMETLQWIKTVIVKTIS